ncbi:DNA-methyltransferase [Mycobacteroides chelonae]|uniref:DNA-methyltransferase n=1 Tax=Mycobacteroides chelonae TaxID=1774 RepID=UPI0013F4BE68|nr:site-specific DNA-methyltransferase [Mycobacteroides chelonae]
MTPATSPDRNNVGPPPPIEAYATGFGTMYQALIEDFLDSKAAELRRKVQLIFFSPPFPLNRKKKYGNLSGDEYLKWLAELAPRLAQLLRPKGSLVMELGNAWEPGRPVMSLLPLKALMEVAESANLNVCQQFVCHNPARLPSPAQWVTVERIRVKDSYTHVWWMSPDEKPRAFNARVLRPYSSSMAKLHARGSYNDGKRPSGFNVSPASFLVKHSGSIPPNALEVDEALEAQFALPENFFNLANTSSNDPYTRYCRNNELIRHPARMPAGLPNFFIKMLTNKGDLVLDPFGGSNTTGAVAEQLERRWISVEPNEEYIAGSIGRFPDLRDV